MARRTPALVPLAALLVSGACTVGLDAPLAAVDGGSLPGADAGPIGAEDAHTPDPLDAQPTDTDARPAEDALVAPTPDGGVTDAVVDGGAMAPADAGDAGVALEACTALPLLASCAEVALPRSSRAQRVRVASGLGDQVLIAFTTDTALEVWGVNATAQGLDTPVPLLEVRLPYGGRPVDVGITADPEDAVVVVASEHGLACRQFTRSGLLTSSTSVRLDGVIAADVVLYDDDVVVAAARAVGGGTQLVRWDDDDSCPGWGTGGNDGQVVPSRARPRDVALRAEGDEEHLAYSSTAAVDGGLFLEGFVKTLVAPDLALAGPVVDARVDVVREGMGHHGALATRATDTAPWIVSLLDAPSDGQRHLRGTRTIAGDFGLSRCGGMCTALASSPAHSPGRVELEFFDRALAPRGGGQRFRVACPASGAVASLDVDSSPQNNRVVVAWSDGNELRAAQCSRP